MPRQLVTLDPDPPIAGQPCTMCYEFTGPGIPDPMPHLVVSYKPGELGGDEFSPTPSEPCKMLYIPVGCTGGSIVEDSGYSDDLMFFCDS